MSSPENPLQISVVMATYNRGGTLADTIRHLDEQNLDHDAYEVIIVDDGSSDDTRDVVEAAGRRVRFRLKYLQHENRGPGFTENRGIREAAAPLILLMADDILLAPGALRTHVEAHERRSEPSVAVLGRVVQSERLNQTAFLRNWDPMQLSGLAEDAELPYYMFWACNISFKRDFMLEHGMFRDERGKGGAAAHEDAELGYRLSRHGLRVIHERDALGYHEHAETLEGARRRSYERGLNWHDFRRLVPTLEVAIRYRVYNPMTVLGNYRKIVRNQDNLLMGPDSSAWNLIQKYIVRNIVFNRVTVPLFWVPLLSAAEHNRVIERLVRPGFYRSVVVYDFLRGCRDGRRVYGDGGGAA